MTDKEGIEQAIMLDCLGQFEVIEFSRTLYLLCAGNGKSAQFAKHCVSRRGLKVNKTILTIEMVTFEPRKQSWCPFLELLLYNVPILVIKIFLWLH